MVHSLWRHFFTKLNTFLVFDPVILYYNVYPKDLNIFVQTKPAYRFLLQHFFFKIVQTQSPTTYFSHCHDQILNRKAVYCKKKKKKVYSVVWFEGSTHCGRTSRGGMTGPPHRLGGQRENTPLSWLSSFSCFNRSKIPTLWDGTHTQAMPFVL